MFSLSDGTTYIRYSDGSWRRDPLKLNGRDRKRARKRERRQRLG